MPSCPDCDAEMRETDRETSSRDDGIRIDVEGGLLGKLDFEGEYLNCHVCPECGLARFYADP